MGSPPRFAGPFPPTALIGRAADCAAVRALLERARLVTLTGPPGVGKTLLAQHITADLSAGFAGGATWVALDALRDADLVPDAIARALGVRETTGSTLTAAITGQIGDRRLLLVLDNVEHLVEAALVIAELLAACPALVILATGRAPWRIRAEQQYALEPLETRPTGQAAIAAWMQEPGAAVELFVARVRAALPDFALAAENSTDIALICRRLDGLPLALELAAARAKTLSVRMIAQRLEQRFRLLVNGPRDLPARHQTLLAAISWSYELLDADEQRLFRAAGVFAGGATLEAYAAVVEHPADVAADTSAVLNRLETLVEHSLVRRAGTDGERYVTLESLRAFAAERLEAEGELAGARRRHAAWCLELTQEAVSGIVGPEQARWVDRLTAERDNLRAALGWALETGETTLGLRVAVSMQSIWVMWGAHREALSWYERLLAADEAAPPALRARALLATCIICERMGDYAGAEQRGLAALDPARASGDDAAIAQVLYYLGVTAFQQTAL
ncbi:MAG TPA: AAA family ATPase, partial [Dehalococcoidia bacterium]|nr:AAA family ATPase [Dehalococcoidia bacterium]